MSASASKKKRKELDEQGLSAKQLEEQKIKDLKKKNLRKTLLIVGVIGIIMGCFEAIRVPAFFIIALSTLAFGYFFAIRVGGADMPITISLLNSLSGVAGAIAGMAIYNILLVAIGGIVGSSGVLLTQIMCRAMNRKLSSILLGKSVVKPAAPKQEVNIPVAEPVVETKKAAAEPEPEVKEEAPAAVPTLADVKDLIIVPGYGMALSQAQHKVKELADVMEARGCRVRYAIHPVAGRMPGHMNVLLAEVDVDYDQLCELDMINDDFKDCDAVLVVGASDVMNPAAREAEGTPIYGMPILNVDQAPMVFVCNYNLQPGYAGVHNPIYDREEGIRILLGDAKESLQVLLDELSAAKKAAAAPAAENVPAEETAAVPTLADVKDLIIVPGYGMALSQAQSKVKELADMMEARGCRVRYAIHPVAGRMPGHMNVLLAEVDVDYDLLCELDSINDDFKDCDAVLVVGASDVMNPAAREAEGTPIYGMPILNVDQAPMVFVCNFNLEPGYAGVHNPIYDREEGIRILLGDAKDSLQVLIDELNAARKAAVLAAPAAEAASAKSGNPDAERTLDGVKDLIIVPGYGMALSQAQSKVKSLADMMEARGCRVRYAIHPVAGRMPGHMNVLLAEVDVDYDLLCELDSINDDFKDCDAVLVVGASDVMNPAAHEAEGTPIYGMPILNVDQAPMVFVCNFNLEPGYAGVPNPIYDRKSGIRILLGDAKDSLQVLMDELRSPKKPVAESAPIEEAPVPAGNPDAKRTLEGIKDLIIVPGYGMALSQAQRMVKRLADKMESKGCRVRYAIHPVAGRMPGHMNVLLAEVDVDYDLLCELDAINDDFKDCDAVLVVGASDVMNPAAREAEGTPIYGMPILNVDQAPMVFVCNFNLEPGYAGVPNPIYDRKSGIRILLGDAKESLQILLDELN